MYADDLIIYGRATIQEAIEIRNCVQLFCNWTGQEVNFGKSSIHFSRNTGANVKTAILDLLGMKECNHRTKYLGLPLCKSNHKGAAFSDLIDKVGTQLASWKAKHLSFAGRGVLARTIAQTIPSYAMQTYLLPKKVCTRIDAQICDFWWGFNGPGEKHLYLKAWDTICVPKEAGGLGFRRMYDINTAFITKLTWLLNLRTDKLWIQVLKARYCRGLNFMMDPAMQNTGSWVWKSIVHCKASFMRGVCFKVERHSRLKIRDTPWIPFAPQFKVPTDVVIPESLVYVKDLMNPEGNAWNINLL